MTQLHNDKPNNMLSEEVHVSLEEHFADVNNSLLRYEHYQILAAHNVSRSISATLRELNTISCPGREYHNGLLQISRNAIDGDADMYNNNFNNTLHEDVNVLIKEFLADINNSSLSDEVVSLICFFPSCGISCLSYNLFWRTRILRVFATHTVVVTALRPSPAYISADDLDRAVGAFTLLVCLCCDKDNVSKRLYLLPFRNHSHMTPTRRTLCLTQHLYPRALPA